MISEAKFIANRQNATLSTGPSTPEGKARVSQNAARHGMRSRNALLFTENPQEFRDHLAAFSEEWQPATRTERELVEQMAIDQWKIARYEGAESRACEQATLFSLCYRIQQGEPDTNKHDLITSREAAAERAVTRWGQTIARLERSYYRALNYLLRLQELRRKRKDDDLAPAEPAEPVTAPPPRPKTGTAGESAHAPVVPIAADPRPPSAPDNTGGVIA